MMLLYNKYTDYCDEGSKEKEDRAIEICYSGSPVHTSVITLSVLSVRRLNLTLECVPMYID